MSSLRRLSDGSWNKDPSLYAARRLIFTGLSKHHRLVALGHAAKFLNGTSYDKDHVHPVGAMPIIRISNISDPTSQFLRTDEALPDRFLVVTGDLLVSWSASFKSIIWPGPSGYLNQHIFKVSEQPGFDRSYIRHAIEASFDEMREGVVGIGMMHLRRSAFLSHEIPSPPIRLQRAVAQYLDVIECAGESDDAALGADLSREVVLVERVRKLVGRIEEAKRLRGEAEEAGAAYAVSLHLKLAGARTKALGEILVLDEDAQPVKAEDSYPQVGVRSFGAGLFRKGPVQGSDTTYRAFNRLYAGAVVLSQVKGWEGAIAVSPADLEGWYVSPEYRTFRCRPTEAVPSYLETLLPTEWFWSQLGAATRGVGARRERTRPEQFLALRIPMPGVSDQEFAACTFKRLRGARADQSATAGAFDAIVPALLDKAFRGEM